MLGLWNDSYKVCRPERYGSDTSYRRAEEHLKGLAVEDWGCGEGRFKSFHDGDYLGVDGSETREDRKIRDLRDYTSSSPGILLRHVLEHNHDWRKIIGNAIESATDTLVVVIFTPLADETRVISWNHGIEVPDIAFSLSDLRQNMPRATEYLNLKSPSTQYGVEHIFVVHKERESHAVSER